MTARLLALTSNLPTTTLVRQANDWFVCRPKRELIGDADVIADQPWSAWHVLISQQTQASTITDWFASSSRDSLPAGQRGVFEIGISLPSVNNNQIICVYFGRAIAVRARLDRYARHGLDFGSGFVGMGFTIHCRWSLCDDPESATDFVDVETRLLEQFDWACNKNCSGTRSLDEVLLAFDGSVESLGLVLDKGSTVTVDTVDRGVATSLADSDDDDDSFHSFD